MATATIPEARTAAHAVSLLLSIDGQGYRVERIGPAAVRLHKLGPDGLAYDVRATADGIACTCPAAAYHPETRCKHAAAALETRLVAEARGAGGEDEPDPEPVYLHPVSYRGSNGLWYPTEREARSVYSWQQDDPDGRERPWGAR
jgi:hypothetical protein